MEGKDCMNNVVKADNKPLNISLLWDSKDESEWKAALTHYDEILDANQIEIENRINTLNVKEIKSYSTKEFYNFLYNEYFVWKFTAKNRLVTTRNSLIRYEKENRFDELEKIKINIFSLNHSDIKICLKTAMEIHGLGTAGASGLLSVLFPEDFGTVDQFVVKALCDIKDLEEHNELIKINPDRISLNAGVLLISIMRRKAAELNKCFNTNYWTPRKIDMILWCIGR